MIGRLKKMASSKLHEQQGAYTIEFLAVLTGLLALILILLQLSLALLQGIVFNHALSLAAQQAAARGGSDASVVDTFESHLMPGMKAPSDQQSLYVFRVPAPGVEQEIYSEAGGNGREPTRFGELFCVRGAYKPVLLPLSQAIGFGSQESSVSKTLTVSSQSSRDTTETSTKNQGCSS